MTTQPSTPNKINFLEIVDSYIVYSIGNSVYQIEVTQEDLEDVLGSETRKWECNYSGKFYSDNEPIYASLEEVNEMDYVILITTLISKAEDITDAYEKPITDSERELMRIIELSNQESVRRELYDFMIKSRLAQQGYSFHLVFS